MTKVLSILMIVSLLFLSFGCAASTGSTDPAVTLAQNKADVRDISQVSTTVLLLNLDNGSRQEVGKYAYLVSSSINKTVVDGTLDLSSVKNLTLNLIRNSNLKNKDAVELLLVTVEDIIERRVGEIHIINLDHDTVTRSLIGAATEGVMNATKLYAPAPSTGPTSEFWLEERLDPRWLRPEIALN